MRIKNNALSDIRDGFKNISIAGMLGWEDVKQRYRRSKVGPFWLTISTAVMIGTMGLVFGTIFKSNLDEFLPYLTVGILLWGFISSVILEGCMCFVEGTTIIKQLKIPLIIHVFRVLWKNVVILLHNIVIIPVVFLYFHKGVDSTLFLSFIGLLLLLLNLGWMVLLLGILCTRYRDLPQIIASLLQMLFYLTPIVWMPKLMPDRVGVLLIQCNPFFHMLDVVRAPILGEIPGLLSWFIVVGSAILGWGVSIFIYDKYRNRIPYWL